MNCDGIRTATHEYLKGWLEPREAQAVRSHLDGCPACSQEYQRTRSSLALLEILSDIEATPETWTCQREQCECKQDGAITTELNEQGDYE